MKIVLLLTLCLIMAKKAGSEKKSSFKTHSTFRSGVRFQTKSRKGRARSHLKKSGIVIPDEEDYWYL